MDVGWKMTAATWGAWDRENDVLYLYSEYRRGQAACGVVRGVGSVDLGGFRGRRIPVGETGRGDLGRSA